MAKMTHKEFLDEFVKRIKTASNRGMIDEPAIQGAVDWAADVIRNSDWSEQSAEDFLNDALKELGYSRPKDQSLGETREYIKKAYSNSALLALMAASDKLLTAPKAKK